DLCQVANAVGTLAASDTAAGAFFRFRNGAAFPVGTVTPCVGDACFTAPVTGMTTTNNAAAPFTNDIDLVTTAGGITLAQQVNARSEERRVGEERRRARAAEGSRAKKDAKQGGQANAEHDRGHGAQASRPA